MENFKMWIRVCTSVAVGAFIGVYSAAHITNIALQIVTK